MTGTGCRKKQKNTHLSWSSKYTWVQKIIGKYKVADSYKDHILAQKMTGCHLSQLAEENRKLSIKFTDIRVSEGVSAVYRTLNTH